MVKCEICGDCLRQITNTHLRSHHLTAYEYQTRFPNSPRVSPETSMAKSKVMMGKNLGNKRPDAKEYMTNNNPMTDPEVAKRMSKSRQEGIARGEIDALANLGHLPTPNEKAVQAIFDQMGIPLIYVGNGAKWINGKCPDFINEERKVVLELDLDKWFHPEEKAALEAHYLDAGYRCITLTKIDALHIRKWVKPFFLPAQWQPVVGLKSIPGKVKVYNYHILPNENFFANRILVHNCFADYFRHSLYTSFFDNGKSLGLRHCDPAVVNTELDKLMVHRGEPVSGENEVLNAIRLGIPMRFGIRFEDFTDAEAREGVSLAILQNLQRHGYPVMINTKSALPGQGPYLEALANNPGKAAVHFTLISSDDDFLSRIEPGAPKFMDRLAAAAALTSRGVRVVARVEPWMVFLNDEKDKVDEYIQAIKAAGIRHMTFDSYSYSANSKGLATNFNKLGMDWDRMFTLSSDSQGLSSLLLGKFIEYFRGHGISCSTFDQGNVPSNDDWICCSVGDWFPNFNWGSGVIAIKFIQSRGTQPTRWSDFNQLVESRGGWLSSNLKKEVRTLWNGEGDMAWPLYWGAGMEACGSDRDGMVWRFRADHDFRHDLLHSIVNPRGSR